MLRETVSVALNLPVAFLDKLSRTASYRYKTYTIQKRTGGSRIIHHPSRELKAIQKWLLREILREWPVHEAAHAYELGRNIRTNAEVHRGARFLLRMDFAEFFPSLQARDILTYLTATESVSRGWTDADRGFFVNAVWRNETLTIGAPTSPKLSNVLCHDLDARLAELAARYDANYTRYADDLFFSCQHSGRLAELEDEVRVIVDRIELPGSLSVNEQKTHHSSKRGRQVVAGLILTPQGGISIGRRAKRRVQARVHQFDTLSPDEQSSLGGYLAYVESVEPTFLNQLVMKYGAEHMRRVMDI